VNNYTVTLEAISCGHCGIVFAVPVEWYNKRTEDHSTWYCPNGHRRCFVSESDTEKYKRLLEQEQREAAALRERATVAEKAKSKIEKKLATHKKRAAAGVCPCCNRTVKQLAAHMKSKHADFMQLQGITPHRQLPEKVQ
jgi:hypothetical protein